LFHHTAKIPSRINIPKKEAGQLRFRYFYEKLKQRRAWLFYCPLFTFDIYIHKPKLN